MQRRRRGRARRAVPARRWGGRRRLAAPASSLTSTESSRNGHGTEHIVRTFGQWRIIEIEQTATVMESVATNDPRLPHRHPRPRRRRRAVGPHRPLSKLSLDWLGGGWLPCSGSRSPRRCCLRRQRGLRAALTPGIAGAGAIGFGAVILLRTWASAHQRLHAALVVGAVPVHGGADRRRARPGRRGPAGPGAATGSRWPGSRWSRAAAARARRRRRPAGVRLRGAVGGLHRRPAAAARRAATPRPSPPSSSAPAGSSGSRSPSLFEGVPAGPGGRPGRRRWCAGLRRDPAPVLALRLRSGRLVPAGLAGSFLDLEPLVGVAVGWVALRRGVGRRPAPRRPRRARRDRAQHRPARAGRDGARAAGARGPGGSGR